MVHLKDTGVMAICGTTGFRIDFTDDIEKVTCLRCIRTLKRVGAVSKEQPAPAVGQIWRENENGSKRLIAVTGVSEDRVEIRTVFKTFAGYTYGKHTKADIRRFNGEYHGYIFVAKDVESVMK